MANVLANIFGSSPVKPLEQHIDLAYRCAKKLHDFFAASVQGDWATAAAVRDEIETLEHEADSMKKEIRLHLPKSLFMPVPREDLLELLLVQDKIANRTKDVSGLVLGRKMQLPEQIAEHTPEEMARSVSIDLEDGSKRYLFIPSDLQAEIMGAREPKVIELTGEIADMAERVGRRLELLLSH